MALTQSSRHIKYQVQVWFNNTGFYGHVVPLDKCKSVEHTTGSVGNSKFRWNLTDGRTVIGICNIYLKFVANFALNASLCNKQLKRENLVS